MNRLLEYFEANNKNQIVKWMHYFDVYDRHFSKFRNTPVTVVEIGIADGGSLYMWKDYFGPQATIHGVDIDPRGLKIKDEQIHIHIGSQSDRDFLQSLVKQIPTIDILIDDGGHTMLQQITSFEELFPHVSDAGVYLCEDLHTSYWPEYGGGYKNPQSYIEYSKNFIDVLNAHHAKDHGIHELTNCIQSLHYYDSMLVIEKTKRDKPYARTTGVKTL